MKEILENGRYILLLPPFSFFFSLFHSHKHIYFIVANNQCSDNKNETGNTEGYMNESICKERAEVVKNDVEQPLFNWKRVLAVTNNFNVANKLGEGGFSLVL